MVVGAGGGGGGDGWWLGRGIGVWVERRGGTDAPNTQALYEGSQLFSFFIPPLP